MLQTLLLNRKFCLLFASTVSLVIFWATCRLQSGKPFGAQELVLIEPNWGSNGNAKTSVGDGTSSISKLPKTQAHSDFQPVQTAVLLSPTATVSAPMQAPRQQHSSANQGSNPTQTHQKHDKISVNMNSTHLERAPTVLLASIMTLPTRSPSPSPSDVSPFSSAVSQPVSEHQTTSSNSWKCCIDPAIVTADFIQPAVEVVQLKDYSCKRPSNFSWYYNTPGPAFDEGKWANKSYYFVGGSTTRQMMEQLQWELPTVWKNTLHHFENRYIFEKNETVETCCIYNNSHVLNLRTLSPGLVQALERGDDFIIVNVGVWWETKTVGTIIDEQGAHWSVRNNATDPSQEWVLLNSSSHNDTLSVDAVLDVTFASLMRKAFLKILELKKPHTQVIWRSETKTWHKLGTSIRDTVGPVLRKLGIPILNISQATYEYAALELDDLPLQQPHMCFPSVAIRHWLQEFQTHFL